MCLALTNSLAYSTVKIRQRVRIHVHTQKITILQYLLLLLNILQVLNAQAYKTTIIFTTVKCLKEQALDTQRYNAAIAFTILKSLKAETLLTQAYNIEVFITSVNCFIVQAQHIQNYYAVIIITTLKGSYYRPLFYKLTIQLLNLPV